MKRIVPVLLLSLLLLPLAEAGRKTSSHSGSSRSPRARAIKTPKRAKLPKAKAPKPAKAPKIRQSPASCASCARDSEGRIARSSKATRTFQKSKPCPSTGKTSGACPGYVIDHVVPLKRGGADSPSNMQWQTVTAAKAKDRVE